MKPHCKGCEEEWSYACMLAKDGFHLVQQEIIHIGEKGHFRIFMVYDDGDIAVM